MDERVAKMIGALIIMAAFILFTAPISAPAGLAMTGESWTVTTTTDDTGECTAEFCTLRAAILAAEADPEMNGITFDIPQDDPGYDPSTGQWTISLSSALPPITEDGLFIDANSQPGGMLQANPYALSCPAPKIVIDASSVPVGLEITAKQTEITGLVIQNAQSHGISIHDSTVEQIGLICNQVINNGEDGIHIADDAHGVGVGLAGGYGNLISGNAGDGIEIDQSDDNHVIANYIGTNTYGDSLLPNGSYGIYIHDCISNTIGGGGGDGNLISGNATGGILIASTGTATYGHLVMGNTIGTNAMQDAALPNYDGVIIAEAFENMIEQNLIAGNTRYGIDIQGYDASNNTIAENYIGEDAHGNLQTGNGQFGIVLRNESGPSTIIHNAIRHNGYDGDYATTAGVAILTSSSTNLLQDNTIADNGGDGVFISGAAYNRLDQNSIYGNLLLGINNNGGSGNMGINPPKILSYSLNGSYVTLQAMTSVPDREVQIYSDNDGEGRFFEGSVVADSNGLVNWSGTPTAGAFTLIAFDTYGDTSEFSPSPVDLNLSIDGALPGTIVNKVAGDADGYTGNTMVEFTAYIVGYDPTLTQDLDLEFIIPGDVLSSPTSVFYRDNISYLDGTGAVTWSSPYAGSYQVTGIDLLPNSKNTQWTRRIVFRFDIPGNLAANTYTADAYLTVTGRTMRQDSASASMQLLSKAEGIILTNYTRLYDNTYQNNDDLQVQQLLQSVYTLAQGTPYNNSPKMVVYYVDAYNTDVYNWDNTQLIYSVGELNLNQVSFAIDSLLEDWVEDSTSAWTIDLEDQCLAPVDNPVWLIILGDDDVIPYYRRDDPTDKENEHDITSDTVLHDLVSNDYMFTDNLYADFSQNTCDINCPWDEGCVELYTGRIVGGSPAEMQKLISNGIAGTSITGYTLASSYDGNNINRIADAMTGRGFDVFNDDEEPNTLENDDWTYNDIIALLGRAGGFSAYAHMGHANNGSWCTPPADGGSCLTPYCLTGSILTNITTYHPFFTSNGCRSGLALGTGSKSSMIYGLVDAGASGILGSTAISQFWKYYDWGLANNENWGEELVQDYWEFLLTTNPGNVSSGYALQLAKRYYSDGLTVEDAERKMWMEFTLFGLPWVGIYGNVNNPNLNPADILSIKDTAAWPMTGPFSSIDDIYTVTFAVDASDYSVSSIEGYDLVSVSGMDIDAEQGSPAVPGALLSLHLPPGSAISSVNIFLENATNLGTLNLPMVIPSIPMPGGDPGGLVETPDSVGIYPTSPYTVSLQREESSLLARLRVIPLEYDAVTDQATLYSSITVRVAYQLSNRVGLLSFSTSPDEFAPAEAMLLHASLVNASDEPAILTGTLTMKNSQGDVVGTQEIAPFEAPAAETDTWEGSWNAPSQAGSYDLYLEMWEDGSQVGMQHQVIVVVNGWLSGPVVPAAILPGQAVELGMSYENLGEDIYIGVAQLAIYDARGSLVGTQEEELSVPGHGISTFSMTWNTLGVASGSYSVVVTIQDESRNISLSTQPASLRILYTIFIPMTGKN